jgi:hypothetical protein
VHGTELVGLVEKFNRFRISTHHLLPNLAGSTEWVTSSQRRLREAHSRYARRRMTLSA